MKKLLNVTSKEYDKAQALSWFHAVVAPIILVTLVWLSYGIFKGVMTGITYILVLLALNVLRLFISDKPFEHEKFFMFLNALQYLLLLVLIVTTFLVVTLYGVYHA